MGNFKIVIKRILLVLLTLFIILKCIVYYMNLIGVSSSAMEDYYQFVDNNVVDVACIGSSHLYQGIDPILLWDDYNIAAYDFASGSQSIWASYVYLKQILIRQNPALVVLDVYTIGDADDEYYDTEAVEMNFVPLFPTLTKLYVLLSTKITNPMDVFLTFPIMHTNYDKLAERSFNRNIYNTYNLLGYSYSTEVNQNQSGEVYDARTCSSVKPCTEKAELYLRKCIELCKKRGIPVLLTNAPTVNISEEKQAVYNYIQQIADEYDVDFVNGCLLYEEMGIDYSTDDEDGGHINHSGCEKYTKWLGEYINNHYDIAPKDKNDKKYKFWNVSSDKLKARIMLDEMINKNAKMDEISHALNSEGWAYVYINSDKVEYVEDGCTEFSFELNEEFDRILYWGDDIIEIKYDGRCIWVTENRLSEIIYIDTMEDECLKNAMCIFSKSSMRNERNLYFDDNECLISND